ncbi:MAG: hypothetical protein AAGD05_07030 [Bacteroidota bacterium]
MKVVTIAVGELQEFIQREQYAAFEQVPITPLRAHSQFHNPNAQKNDVALVLALSEEGQVLSYMGCLPDRLAADPTRKICWCSCWWTHPEKGAGTAMPVLYQALQSWQGQMLFDALPPRSIAILERLRFLHFETITGQQFSLRFKLAQALPKRFSLLKPGTSILQGTDWMLNQLQGLRLRKKQADLNNWQLTWPNRIDAEAAQFIQKQSQQELIARQAPQLNWVLDYPWLDEQTGGEGPFSQSYFFSAHAQRFFYRILQLTDGEQNEIKALLILSYRDGVVRLPYVYAVDEAIEALPPILFEILVDWSATTLICFHAPLIAAFQKRRLPFLFQKAISKTLGIPLTLQAHLAERPKIQDGDGDVVFT